jgi:DNA repair ATPase RecN
LRREVVTAERAVQETQRPIAEITAEQERIRANLQTLQRGTPLHERLVAKLNSQETELENHGKTLTKARERLARAQSALESHLAGLTIE